MPWIMPLKTPQWRMCQLTNFGTSNEETESKIEIYEKNWARYALSKILTLGQSQLVQDQSQRILVQVDFGFSGRVTGQAAEPLTSSYDVSLTWTRADVEVLAWLLTWSDDVIRWRQMTSTAVFDAWLERVMFTGAWRRRMVERVRSNGGQNLEFRRSVDEEADKATRVTKEDLPVRIPMWRVRDIPELTVAHGGTWLGFGWPDF